MSRFRLVVARAFAAPVLATVFAAAPLVAFAQAAAPKAEPAPDGAQIASTTCVACHAADGNSETPANPKLAAQHADYLFKQLKDFKVAEGATAAARPDPIMAGFAGMLSEADMRAVANYYAAQTLKPATASNRDTIEQGQRIYRAGIADKGVPACAGCHSPNGAGIPALYPRLNGQFTDYTKKQLVAFRQGDRHNSPEMKTIAERMSDREIDAVSDYIAGLR